MRGRLGAWSIAASAMVLVACLPGDPTTCADGTVCAAGHACAPLGGCAPEAQLAACEGAADGDACAVPGAPAGVCVSQICVARGCGNLLVEPGELCDDGNQDGGDGCSAACDSDERCGNARVDLGEECDCGDGSGAAPSGCRGANADAPEATCLTTCRQRRCGNAVVDPGEACDDGNATSGDGCDRTCGSTEACGNGQVDVGEACDLGPANADAPDAGCRLDCRLPRCGDGILDVGAAEACDAGAANSDAPGAGCRLDCQPRRCGDGIVDPSEACDDGNVVPLDGCAYDCASDETCGNGWTDFVLGETCDDGNLRDRDGCGGTCHPEAIAWHAVGVPDGPPAELVDHGMAYDAARDRVVVFGGDTQSGARSRDTWEWDGARWTRLAPATSPSWRIGVAMAYDEVRHRVVLFGGATDAGFTHDTWTWDGTTWTEASPATAPSPRGWTAAAWDGRRDRMVIVGGADATGTLGDAWAWNGTSWVELAAAPSARRSAGLAYDAPRDRLVLFGGVDAAGTPLADTWESDGLAWTQVGSGPVPPVDRPVALAFDGTRADILMFGAGLDAQRDTWAWDGAAWSRLVDGAAQPLEVIDLGGAPMVYDSRRREIVRTGGIAGHGRHTSVWDGTRWQRSRTDDARPADLAHGALADTGPAAVAFDQRGDTWAWSGGVWTWRASGGPPRRHSTSVAFDTDRSRLVLFGGAYAVQSMNDTWEWDGAAWIERTPTTRPTDRAGHALAYDPVRRRTVLFGGAQSSPSLLTFLTDTWEWDGNDWSPRAPTTSPPPRYGATLSWDRARGNAVLFGGFDDNFAATDQTWLWNGTAWSLASPAVAPPARFDASATFDATRQRVVVFSGRDDETVGFGDLWTWDGTTWAALKAEDTPPRGDVTYSAETGRLMVVDDETTWNLARGRWRDAETDAVQVRTSGAAVAVLRSGDAIWFGGHTDDDVFGDTWRWRDGSWTPVPTTVAPTARAGHALAYDEAGGVAILFGGLSRSRTLLADTWQWDGAAWSALTPAQSPSPREGHALAYDGSAARIVLFGGRGEVGPLGDTWTWDGDTWTSVAATGPSARRGHSVAYDRARARVVLFGGDDGALRRDTWAWDGAAWSELATGEAPLPRRRAGLAYHPDLARVVLVGGEAGFVLDDAWALDGATWQRLAPTGPAPAAPPVVWFDPTRRELVAATGIASTGARALRFGARLAAEACVGGVDYDDDGVVACADPDCWGVCAPTCSAADAVLGACDAGAPTSPWCGDGACTGAEDCRRCAADCGTCAAACPDAFCDPPETPASCPSDCAGAP